MPFVGQVVNIWCDLQEEITPHWSTDWLRMRQSHEQQQYEQVDR